MEAGGAPAGGSVFCEHFEANQYVKDQCINCFHVKADHNESALRENVPSRSVHTIRATLNQRNVLLRATGSAEQRKALRIQNIQAEILSTESSYLEQLNRIIQVCLALCYNAPSNMN